MVNQQTLQGNWNEIKGKLRNKWGQLTNDDLQQAHGNVDQLVGLIQRKTGEARTSVEKFLEDATGGGASALNEATETAHEYAQQAMETVQERVEAGGRVGPQGLRPGSRVAEARLRRSRDMIKERPAESAAVCFGVGMLVGVLLGLTLRSR